MAVESPVAVGTTVVETCMRRAPWSARWFSVWVPIGVVARKAVRGAVIWALVFGLVSWLEAAQFAKEYPTAADRAHLVATMGTNIGITALFGPSPEIDTAAGYVATHAVGVLGIIGAVWGRLAGTRLLRGEEDAGRWEVLLAGATTPRRATAAGQIGATREEEASGRLDHLLSRPVARMPWLTQCFIVSATALIALGLIAGVLVWLGTAITNAGLGFGTILAAGVNVIPVGILVLGIGTLAHGLLPRFAAAIAYAVVAWSFLVEIIGASLGISRWLLDSSVLQHIFRAPAVSVDWNTLAVLNALGIAAAAAGAWAFERRDLESA